MSTFAAMRSPAAEQVKLYGKENDLLRRLEDDPVFALHERELKELTDPAGFTGLAGEQCEKYLREEIRPLLEANDSSIQEAEEIRV